VEKWNIDTEENIRFWW